MFVGHGVWEQLENLPGGIRRFGGRYRLAPAAEAAAAAAAAGDAKQPRARTWLAAGSKQRGVQYHGVWVCAGLGWARD